MQESGFGGLQTYPGEQPQSASLPVSWGFTGAVFNGAAQVVTCETVAVLRIETGEGDDVPCGCVAPIIEAIADAIPPALFDDDIVIAGGEDCKTDTVAPGPVTVMV